MIKKGNILTFLMLTLIGVSGIAQIPRPKNLDGKFNGEERRFHFGFILGYNRASFIMDRVPDCDSPFCDSLLSVNVEDTPGFQLAIVSQLHVNNNFKIRFTPGLSFQERVFEYRYLKADGEIEVQNPRLESTFLDFPLLFKMRTNRINNFAAYVLGGGQYSLDMASQINAQNSVSQPILKIERPDWSTQIGGGFDFYLPYFKFGIELKYTMGIFNVLVKEGFPYDVPLSRLRTQVWMVNFTFEG